MEKRGSKDQEQSVGGRGREPGTSIRQEMGDTKVENTAVARALAWKLEG